VPFAALAHFRYPVVPRVAGRARLQAEALFGRRSIETATTPEETPVEQRLAALFDYLGIARAHLAGRAGTDWQGLASRYPERVASLTLLCPAALDRAALQPLSPQLLIVTGDQGPGAQRVQAVLSDLPRAETAVLRSYAGLTWSDLATERGDEILGAMCGFLSRHDANASLTTLAATAPEGEIAGISYRVQGAGPPLVLLPLELSPRQWGPLIPALAVRWTTITLGGAHLGSVASLEERGRSGYIGVVRGLVDQLTIRPGEQVVEVGCGSGVIMRELARRTVGANRLTGIDQNLYLMREARALAGREGLADRIALLEGTAEALPLPDGFTDVAMCCTVAEEGDAERMFSELVRITKPGGRVGVIVRAIDRGCWINLPLDTAFKAKVEMPGMIGGGMSPGGCANASLYQRFHALGLQELCCFPQLVAVRPGSPRLARYQQQILSALSPRETETWRRAVAQAERDGTYFIAQPFHCAVGTKPA
jgi:SAM-dependent methyltransferase